MRYNYGQFFSFPRRLLKAIISPQCAHGSGHGKNFFISTVLLAFFTITSMTGCATIFKYSEHSPTISADGVMMIYQSDRDDPGKYKLYIKIKTFMGWSPGFLLDQLDSDYGDGAPFITYDQNHLLFSSRRKGGMGDVDIWICERKGIFFTEPVNFGKPINSAGYDGFASLSPDGRTMYLVRRCPGKRACTDNNFGLYISTNDNGRWSEPRLMPGPVNSEFCEFGPVILADNKTLIFSSNRPGGFGGYDLYKTERRRDGTWTQPQNLGKFINTPHDDKLITIPASGDVLYYSRPSKSNPSIYRITSAPIPLDLQHSMVLTLTGGVYDATEKTRSLFSRITITDVGEDSSPITIKSSARDGKYVVILNKGKVYDISVDSPGYTFYSTHLDLTKLSKYREIKKDIGLYPVSAGTKFTLNNLYFKSGEYQLLPESHYELNRIIDFLKKNPGMKIEISGHTDDSGTETLNKTLSEKRAESVVRHLVDNGISAGRLVPVGYGSVRPIASNKTGEGKAENRRVELMILSVK